MRHLLAAGFEVRAVMRDSSTAVAHQAAAVGTPSRFLKDRK